MLEINQSNNCLYIKNSPCYTYNAQHYYEAFAVVHMTLPPWKYFMYEYE